jgi:hypothetical protein
MSERTVLNVRGEFDIIVARSRVRDLARQMGMNTTDQACISLATSSAARALGLGKAHTGQILLEGIRTEERTGVRVVCAAANGGDRTTSHPLDEARMMADDLTVEVSPENETLVTLLKWVR